MADTNEMIGVALTAAIALAVGLTTASFGWDSPPEGSGSGTAQVQTLIDRVVQALAPVTEQIIDNSPQIHSEV